MPVARRLGETAIAPVRSSLKGCRSTRKELVVHANTALAHRSRAVRALVLLHDEHVRRFLVVWNQAQAASVVLPKTDDPAYASLETLLRHVLGRRPRLHDVDVRGTRVTRSRDPHTAGADGPARARGHASDSSCVPARRADAPALNRRGSAG